MTFEEFASARLDRLLRMAYAICRDPLLADDLVQDVLIKVQARWELQLFRAVLDHDGHCRR